MATLYLQAKINATDYGDVGSGAVANAFLRAVSFGAYAAGAAHFDIRNIKVGTTGYGSSDLFAPVLDDLSEFDGVFGSGAEISAAGGVLSVDAASGDHYGYKDFGADVTDLYVQFDLRRRTGDTNPDYHDVWDDASAASSDGTNVDGIYRGSSDWSWDGPGDSFGAGPTGSPTWDTVNLHYSFAAPPSITLTPTAGVVGSTVSISGVHFTPSTSLTATFDGSAVTLSGTTSTDGSGSFSGATFTVPFLPDGSYTVVVSDDMHSPSAPFLIGASPPNTSQADATALVGPCSEMVISNAFAPDTPEGDDPLNTVYPTEFGAAFSRQVWYKLTNTGGAQAYARFTLTAPGGTPVDVAAALYLDDPATDPANSERSDPSGDDVTLWRTPLGGGSSDSVGVSLLAGQTVWLELAGDDTEGDGHGWNGDLTLEWQLLASTFYDAFDDLPATDFLPVTGGTEYRGGLQAPEFGGSLDTLSYAKLGDKHFWASFEPGAIDGIVSVWVWDDGGGAPTIYHVADTSGGSGLTHLNGGSGPGYGVCRPLLRTDGTNLWLVAYEEDTGALVPCPGATDGDTYDLRSLMVFVWTGSGFDSIGTEAGRFTKTFNSGHWTQVVGEFAATADSSDTGHLHVVWCEAGPAGCDVNEDGNPAAMGGRVSYSKWSTSGLVLQNDILVASSPGGSGADPDTPLPALTTYLGMTNAFGNVVVIHGPSDHYHPAFEGLAASLTHGSVVDMYEIDGAGAATLLQSFDISVPYPGQTLDNALGEGTMGMTQRQPQRQLDGQDQILAWFPRSPSHSSIVLKVLADGSSAFSELGMSHVGAFMEATVDDDNVMFGAGMAGTDAALAQTLAIASLSCDTSDEFNPDTAPKLARKLTLGIGVPEFYWDDGADCIYTMGWNGLATPNQKYAPIKIPLLRDYLLCSVGDCVPSAVGLHVWQRT